MRSASLQIPCSGSFWDPSKLNQSLLDLVISEHPRAAGERQEHASVQSWRLLPMNNAAHTQNTGNTKRRPLRWSAGGTRGCTTLRITPSMYVLGVVLVLTWLLTLTAARSTHSLTPASSTLSHCGGTTGSYWCLKNPPQPPGEVSSVL